MTAAPAREPPAENPIWGGDWPAVRALWPIAPQVAHLNHGSFGAVPSPVLEAQDRWRRRIEADPTGFFWRVLPEALDQARLETARFLRADPDGFVFVPNATTAVNTVLASLGIGEGDELLLTDHAYGACRLAAQRWAASVGAVVREVHVPLPAASQDDLVRPVLDALGPRTRVAIVDHVTSPTALVVPVERLVRGLRDHGVLTVVDAAHAPGMLDVDLSALDPDVWTGNFHKWCCSPRGSAGLWVAEAHRDRIEPLVTSWHRHEGFRRAFSWTGTKDETPFLCVPESLRFLGDLGWDRVRRHNRELAAFGARVLGESLGTEPPVPPGLGERVHAAMTLVELPPGTVADEDAARALAARVGETLSIEIAVTVWAGRGFVRLSAQAYNAPGEYERLAEALPALLRPG